LQQNFNNLLTTTISAIYYFSYRRTKRAVLFTMIFRIAIFASGTAVSILILYCNCSSLFNLTKCRYRFCFSIEPDISTAGIFQLPLLFQTHLNLASRLYTTIYNNLLRIVKRFLLIFNRSLLLFASTAVTL